MTIKKIHQIWIADDNAEPSDFIKNQMDELANENLRLAEILEKQFS